jgi:predicted DNA-binding protein YlxM (UPF0122 family)
MRKKMSENIDKKAYYAILFEYYKELLTDKQKNYFEDYYFDNLTMEEIAENDNVSKNAISKQLINIKDKLNYYESILKLYSNKLEIEKVLDKDTLNRIIDYI